MDLVQVAMQAAVGSATSAAVGGVCGGGAPPEPDWSAYTTNVQQQIAKGGEHKGKVEAQLAESLSNLEDQFKFQTNVMLEDYGGGLEELEEQRMEAMSKTGMAYHGGVQAEFDAQKQSAATTIAREFRANKFRQEAEERGLMSQADKDIRMIERDIASLMTQYAKTTEHEFGDWNPQGGDDVPDWLKGPGF
ncbi:hypothetical protein [Acinetobacter sp.]|uniref:hypothetical protein n=1 Tax=Acinetobacter sp. TaxID=472 RepID=UPI000C0B947E|nr:hypothetical protein [Acinetobacter sp.]MAK30292.1 hypothetical protein [Acinetobacter sp.]QDP47202.1 MAG: hypothetical protein GOVbin655_36 [Prokaryotic dsDNA virus sp.]|tara:strand:+ start:3916 stop:4488 length:573 start_codon:yes stop_codon:yes gene_type:complete